jgi:hypothetical protein
VFHFTSLTHYNTNEQSNTVSSRMADNTLILDGKCFSCALDVWISLTVHAGDEPMDQFNLEKDMADMELAVNGELFDAAEIPEEVRDSKSSI